ncbi:MAG: T9SS type A sorting domain-containing protein, partial [Bacteroidales bacterium]|nr:T9SS type A sorting domain-containing protein [Bacteroidales bacterium]
MNKQILLFCLLILFAIAGSAQTVTLTFTGRDGANKHVEMNYVSVSNVTKGWQVLLPWPDTVLTLQNQTGIHDVETAQALSLQMSPNPVDGTTDVTLSLPEEGKVRLEIADMNGRMVETFHETSLQPGAHQFRISLAFAGTYLLTAHHNGQSTSLKMVCHDGGSSNTIQYVGIEESFDP